MYYNTSLSVEVEDTLYLPWRFKACIEQGPGPIIVFSVTLAIGPLQQSDHMVQKHIAGEQIAHWDIQNKAT